MNINNIGVRNRIGTNYFPDTLHYREEDIQKWVPEIRELGFSWLILVTPEYRAIPENFIRSLIKSSITPILHFSNTQIPFEKISTFELLMDNYAKWGVKHVCVYNTPNLMQNWKKNTWLQTNIVDYFLDCYLPYANIIIQHDMVPIFPPLQPGGDFWDLTFLRLALRGILRRCNTKFLERMAVGINAFTYNRVLEWGKGGQENWPDVKPYRTPHGSEDHFGFHIFDWYSEIISSEIGEKLPLIIMRTNNVDRKKEETGNKSINPIIYEEECLAIRNRMRLQPDDSENISHYDNKENNNQNSASLESVPEEVLACNFWLLTCEEGSIHTKYAWFKPDGQVMPVVESFKQLGKQTNLQNKKIPGRLDPVFFQSLNDNKTRSQAKNIRHYLLLPSYPRGITEKDLNKIIPFVERYNPTMGFSLGEALKSSRVTLFGEKTFLPEETISKLHQAGCSIELLTSDGILLAI